MRGLKNKVTIVTGGAQGIGSAVAERFAAEGARIVLTSRDGAKAQEAADALNRRAAMPGAFP